MKILYILGITLAFAMAPIADANADEKGNGNSKTSGAKKSITAPAVKQKNTATSRDDDMEGFLEIVVAVLDEETRSEEPADDVSDDKDNRNEGHLKRNLGLGFAHGMGNNGNNGNGNGNPHNGACNGNGHPGNPNSNGNNGGNGRGHDNHQGNGFGHRDCGEPSPSD